MKPTEFRIALPDEKLAGQGATRLLLIGPVPGILASRIKMGRSRPLLAELNLLRGIGA